MKLPDKMHVMMLEKQKEPLIYKEIPLPAFAPDQLLIKVIACGICRTDMHVIDGDLDKPKLPLILGHEIIG
jgi:propanol-preferring alcohol dehydrogenase